MPQAARRRQGLERWRSPGIQQEGYSFSKNETQASFAWGVTITGGKDPHQVMSPRHLLCNSLNRAHHEGLCVKCETFEFRTQYAGHHQPPSTS